MRDMEQECYVYIMVNPSHTVMYVGMTSDLVTRVGSHRSKLVDGFTKKYNCIKLVYFEQTPDRVSALVREKEIKKWSRVKKASLVHRMNPTWKDLFNDLVR